MIHALEENKILPKDLTYEKCVVESIKCHHNKIANYIRDSLFDKSKDNKNKVAFGIDKSPVFYHNFEFMPDDFESIFKLIFYLMQSKYSALVKLVNDQTHFLIDINDYRVLKYDHIIFDSFVVQQKSTSKEFMITSYFVQDCTNEFTRMMMCRYPSILGIKGFSPVDPDDRPKPSILTDYYKMTLYDYINTRKTGNYTKTNDYIIILGMTIGLRFLNNNGIIHELLHPGSILLDENFYPIIQNVEINKRLIYRFVDQINFMMKQSGYYMSPEQAEEYSFQTSNVFSYSFILYNLITLKHPFDRVSKMSAYKALHMIVNGYRPKLKYY